MQLTATLLSLLPFAFSSPLSTRQTNTVFTWDARNSGSAIDLQTIHAANRNFWIGIDTQTYCPDQSVNCDRFTTNVTALAAGNDGGSAGMYTTVPGGQIVYVETNGAIGFSQAHSSSIPEGSYVSGFTYTPSDTAGVPGRFNFNGGPGSKGWTACPQADGTYKIFARLEGLVFLPECNAFEPFANAYAGARAWQYI